MTRRAAFFLPARFDSWESVGNPTYPPFLAFLEKTFVLKGLSLTPADSSGNVSKLALG
jgi:hypothetical protein